MKKRVCLYLITWIFPIAVFWIFKPWINAAIYSIAFSLGWYNIYAIVVPFNMAKNNDFGVFKWLSPVLIGFLNSLTHPLTFGLAADMNSGRFDAIDIDINDVIYFAILSLASLVVSSVYFNFEKYIKMKSIPFILIWMLVIFSPIVIFWILNEQMNIEFYSMFFPYVWYPIAALALAFFAGKSNVDGTFRWMAPIIICVMNIVAYPLLIGLMNVIGEKDYALIEITYIIIQVVLVIIGFLMGTLTQYFLNRKK